MKQWAVLGLCAACGCANPVRARFPAGAAPGAGASPGATVVLRFTHAVDHVFLSVNGVAVAEDVHTDKLVVEEIPPGPTMLVVAGDGIEKAFTLELEAGEHVVVPLAAAPPQTSRTVLQAVLAAAVYAVYLGLQSAL